MIVTFIPVRLKLSIGPFKGTEKISLYILAAMILYACVTVLA